MKRDEILLSLVNYTGISYYRLKKSDPDVKKFLEIVNEKLKEKK